jgi:hypothetical protein
MDPQELIKNTDLDKIAKEGSLIYQGVKAKYEENSIGKFLAVDIDSKDQYLASTSAEAVIQARTVHPDKVFYVVKIGFDAAETMANLIASKTING